MFLLLAFDIVLKSFDCLVETTFTSSRSGWKDSMLTAVQFVNKLAFKKLMVWEQVSLAAHCNFAVETAPNYTTTFAWYQTCSIPARALMRERSKRRAEPFSLSQSVSAARSQRLLMSLYCCWISKLSKSVGEMVLMLSRLEENTFNLQFRHRDTKAPKLSTRTEKGGNNAWYQKLHKTDRWNVHKLMFGRFSLERESLFQFPPRPDDAL